MPNQVIKIQLSTPQLLSLFENNAELEIEIVKGVQANLSSALAKRVERRLDLDMSKVVKQHVTTTVKRGWGNSEELKPHIRTKITKEINKEVDAVIEEAVKEKIADYLGSLDIETYLRSKACDMLRTHVAAEARKSWQQVMDNLSDRAQSAVEKALKEKLGL
jgi:hypothetical protein